jgi:hypothetical protein
MYSSYGTQFFHGIVFPIFWSVLDDIIWLLSIYGIFKKHNILMWDVCLDYTVYVVLKLVSALVLSTGTESLATTCLAIKIRATVQYL